MRQKISKGMLEVGSFSVGKVESRDKESLPERLAGVSLAEHQSIQRDATSLVNDSLIQGQVYGLAAAAVAAFSDPKDPLVAPAAYILRGLIAKACGHSGIRDELAATLTVLLRTNLDEQLRPLPKEQANQYASLFFEVILTAASSKVDWSPLFRQRYSDFLRPYTHLPEEGQKQPNYQAAFDGADAFLMHPDIHWAPARESVNAPDNEYLTSL